MKNTFSIVIIPSDIKKTRTYKIPNIHLYIFTVLMAIGLISMVVFLFTYGMILKELEVTTTIETEAIEADFKKATNEIRKSIYLSEKVMARLIESSVKQEEELTNLRNRYEALKALSVGQEEIAKVHKEILNDKSLSDRIPDIVIGLLTGIFGTLITTLVIYRNKGNTMTTDDVKIMLNKINELDNEG